MQIGAMALVLALGGPAYAQQPAASAEADALFDEGRALLAKNKLAEACSAFDASQKLAPAVSTVLNQADCREKNKQLATAYGLFRDAERQTRAPLDDGTQKLNKLARDRAKALEPRLSKLVIDVPASHRVPGMEVLRNSAVVDPLTFGRQLPVDGGKYVIVVRAPDHEPSTMTIEVGVEGDLETVTIGKLIEKEKEKVAAPVDDGGQFETRSITSRPTRRLSYVVGGVGGGLVLGAIGLDIWARSQYADSKDEPDDLAQEAQWEGAKTKRYFAQGIAVLGLGAMGVATWLYLREETRMERVPIAITPVVDGETAGLQIGGSF